MKRILLLFALCGSLTAAVAQSLVISRSLELIPNSSAVAQYNNQFSYLNNPELDDPFPFSVIRMDLEGDVRAAKEK